MKGTCKDCRHWDTGDTHGLNYSTRHGKDVLPCNRLTVEMDSMKVIEAAINCAHDGPIFTGANFGCVLFEREEGEGNESTA